MKSNCPGPAVGLELGCIVRAAMLKAGDVESTTLDSKNFAFGGILYLNLERCRNIGAEYGLQTSLLVMIGKLEQV